MLQLKAIKCGKEGCNKCPHGAYVYAYLWEGGKTKAKYIGKFGNPMTLDKIKQFDKKHPGAYAEYLDLLRSVNNEK